MSPEEIDQVIVQLIKELRYLCGWGVSVHRLAPCHTLRDALGVDPKLGYVEAGRQMMRRLLKRIETIKGPCTVQGQLCTGLQVRLAVRLVLKYNLADPSKAPNAKENDAPSRRIAAMRHLGIHQSVNTFRRATGVEADLLAILAEHLLGGEGPAA